MGESFRSLVFRQGFAFVESWIYAMVLSALGLVEFGELLVTLLTIDV